MAFVSPIYQVPAGVRFGQTPISSFSGKPTAGPLANLSEGIFFSPALLEENSGNQLDLAEIKLTVRAGDVYRRPQEATTRLFRFGGGVATILSRTNDTLYRTQPKEYFITATLVQTIPPGPTTVIRIP